MLTDNRTMVAFSHFSCALKYALLLSKKMLFCLFWCWRGPMWGQGDHPMSHCRES